MGRDTLVKRMDNIVRAMQGAGGQWSEQMVIDVLLEARKYLTKRKK